MQPLPPPSSPPRPPLTSPSRSRLGRFRSRSGALYEWSTDGALIRVDAAGRNKKMLKQKFPSRRQRKLFTRTLLGKPRKRDHPEAIKELARQAAAKPR